MESLFGLNINEVMLLCLLSGHENLSAGEISDELGLTRSNASKVIASLESAGLVHRRTCREDGRSMQFRLTKKGGELLDRVHCDQLQLPDALQCLVNRSV